MDYKKAKLPVRQLPDNVLKIEKTKASKEENASRYIPKADPEKQMRILYDEDALAELKKRWGTGNEEHPYTAKDYEMMQETYESFAAEYKGVLPARTKAAIIRIAEATLKYSLAADKGDAVDAKRWQEVIDKIMAGEALKVGDVQAVEKFNISGLAQRLEEKGLMDNGVLVLENVIKYVQNDHGVFHMSKDAMDLSLLCMYNAMMYNNGLPEVDELPEAIKIQNRFGEFLAEPTQEEKEAAMEFGMNLSGVKDGGVT